MGLVATITGGVVFGLALAAPPGPMNAVIAEESALRGWADGFRAGLGAMVADACFLVLALLGAVAVVERTPALRTAMVAVGGLLMLYFAADAARAAGTFVGDGVEPTGESKGFRKAFVLAITNPYQIIFWLTVGVGLLEPGRLDVLAPLPAVGDRVAGAFVVETGSPALLGGLFGGIGLWIVGFPATIAVARRRVEGAAQVIAWLSAAVLAAFGLLFLWDALPV
ncbi:LysE family translocator [Halomicrobium salinisoli]|uniref:LysE family translocator n=1 Tax=Halomicrobium salinisoli TaxID=2878391 RepID=UPI001CEFD0CE|nr:LysE family transporter [Halomicrobium salinisoli]